MRIFPAIDLRGGRVVRLSGGDYDKMTVYGEDPAEQARAFKRQGASCLHVVDLDGARDGGQDNLSSIAAIAREGGLFIEVGGGARDEQSVARYMDLGVNRVILGTLAVENRALTERLAARYPGRVAVGVDARDGRVAIRGWRQITGLDALELVEKLPQIGVHCAIYTDISTDGMLSGTNIKAFETLSQLTDIDIVASGGISFEEEIRALHRLGLYGAIIGKALYTGKLSLGRAIELAGEET